MEINVELGKKGTIGLVVGCVAFPVAVAVIALKANKKYKKKCDDLRQNILNGIDYSKIIDATLGNNTLNVDSSSKIYSKASNLYDTISNSYSLETIKNAGKSLDTLMNIITSDNDHTVQAYARGIDLDEEREERDYLRAVEAKKVQNEQDLAMEKYRTDRDKFSTVADAVVKTVRAAGNSSVEIAKAKAESAKTDEQNN